MKTAGFAGLTAMLLLTGVAVFAADPADESETSTITFTDDKAPEDAYILDKKPNGITIGYKDGCKFILFSDMPSAYRKMFGYDAIRSARYENKLTEQRKAIEREESERKAREKQRKANEDKHYKDKNVNVQLQVISKLESQLEEAKKRLESNGNAVDQARAPGMSDVSSGRVSIESPWGYGERIRSGEHNTAITDKLMKEDGAPDPKRNDDPTLAVIVLQLKLEAAQRTLDELLGNQ